MKPGVGWHSVAGNVHLMIDSKPFLIEPLISPEALGTVPWARAWLSGLASKCRLMGWDARQQGTQGRSAGTAAEDPDPVRKCAKAQIAARSAEKKTGGVLLGARGLGGVEGRSFHSAFEFQPTGRMRSRTLSGGGPVSRKLQTLYLSQRRRREWRCRSCLTEVRHRHSHTLTHSSRSGSAVGSRETFGAVLAGQVI